MSDHATREFEAYRKEEAEARALLDRAAERNEDLSPEEQAQFDKLVESADLHKKRADKLVKMETDGAALAESVRRVLGDPSDQHSGEPAEQRGFDAQLIENIRQTKAEYQRGNSKFEIELAGLVNLEKRAIANFSDAGALYTTDFATQVAIYQRTVSPWINLASVLNADNGRPINLPNLSADPTAYTPGEGTAITESSGTIGSAALTTSAYKALSYVSQETDDDELVGLLPIIARAQGRSLGLSFGSALTAVLLGAMTNGGTATGAGGNGTATVSFFGYEDLIDLKYGAAVPYRQAGVWVVSNGAIKKVRKFKDANGQYLWQPAIAAGQPPSFDDNPIYEDPYLATPASATKSVVFGDGSAVVIKQMALRVATSGEFRFAEDQVALKTVYRAGGALPDAAALRYLVSKDT